MHGKRCRSHVCNHHALNTTDFVALLTVRAECRTLQATARTEATSTPDRAHVRHEQPYAFVDVH